VSDDPDLRSRLERIASSAGDPPEHGLGRVAARRHRRLRRRRGAVATAAVLAVLAIGVPLISQGLDTGRVSVTASGDAEPSGAPAEVPRVVVVRCEQSGIVVPVASVRPQRDGLHIRVVNSLPEPTTVRVRGGDGWSGSFEVGPGDHTVTQPVPPGKVRIGCYIGGQLDQRRIDVVDRSGYYQVPALACDDAEIVTDRDLPVTVPTQNLISAARRALGDGYAIGALRGYPSQRVNDDATDRPAVQAARDGEVVAFVHGRRAGDGSEQWATVTIEACPSVIEQPGAATTSTEPSSSTTADPAPAEGGAPRAP
jgi:hypothetical protein